MGMVYVKLYDISSAISCFKKCIMLENSLEYYKKLEQLLFAKGLINLEDGKISKEILKQIKEDMNRTHYLYLKYLII
jgi:hypothetical protein